MEVLGTVLGTAIQGQIVGKAVTPCIESPLFIGKANSSVAMEELNMTHDTGSHTDTVIWGGGTTLRWPSQPVLAPGTSLSLTIPSSLPRGTPT